MIHSAGFLDKFKGSLFDANDPREVQLRWPMAFVTSLKCPTCIYYGKDEPRLQLPSPHAAAVARRHNLDVRAIEVEGDHPAAITLAIQRSVAFFDRYLPE